MSPMRDHALTGSLLSSRSRAGWAGATGCPRRRTRTPRSAPTVVVDMCSAAASRSGASTQVRLGLLGQEVPELLAHGIEGVAPQQVAL